VSGGLLDAAGELAEPAMAVLYAGSISLGCSRKDVRPTVAIATAVKLLLSGLRGDVPRA
jgi:hypothetical protein